jgi:hypothetical protein
MNHAERVRILLLNVKGLKAREINVIGLGPVAVPVALAVDSDRVRTLRVLITVGRNDLQPGSQPFDFSLSDPALHETRNVDTVFVSGEPN